MNTKMTIAAITLIGAVPFAANANLSSEAALQGEIRAHDQAMMDAFATGDRSVFESALAPEAIYLDENGMLIERAAFVAQLAPLPANVSGHIELGDYRFRRFGPMAMVTYIAHETENYHGQILYTDFLTSETWRETPAGWKMSMAQTIVIQKDPPEVNLSREALASYAGTYSGAPDLVYVIQFKEGQLFGGRQGQKVTPLRAELMDVLFIAGQPRTRKIFQRDAAGSITGFVDRREGRDLVWRRRIP